MVSHSETAEKVASYIGKLRAYYKPVSVYERATMVSYILNHSYYTMSELAGALKCSVGHIHQLKFLGDNLSVDELMALDELEISVSDAYNRFRQNA